MIKIIVKRFVLFTGAQYECSLGLSGYETSFDTLNEIKDFVIKVLSNYDDKTCMEEWAVNDMETGKVLYESGSTWNTTDVNFIEFVGKRRYKKLNDTYVNHFDKNTFVPRGWKE